MYRVLIRECILGFLFWSLFQGLPQLIWFFPMNSLELSGYEAYALIWCMPVVLRIPGVWNFADQYSVKSALRLTSLASFASFQVSETLERLIILAGGNGAALTVFALTLWSKSEYQRSLTFWGLIMGFFATLAGRVWYTTLMPPWWSVTSNNVVIAIGLIATIDKIASGDDTVMEEKPIVITRKPSWLLTSLGFGSLIYLTHMCFAEVSIITRWAVSSYPDTGPLPYPWGAVVFVSLVIGISIVPSSFGGSAIWWLVGTLAFFSMYYFNTWTSFAAGNILAIYTMSIWPEMMDRVSHCPPIRTIALSFVFYLAEIFLMVWTVAYNFVPGGVYTRERTDYLIAVIMVSLGLGLLTSTGKDVSSNVSYIKTKQGYLAHKAKMVIFFCLLIGLAGFVARIGKQKKVTPVRDFPKKDFTALIWTYHFGYDNKGWFSLERSAKMLENTGADFITLLESDASKPFHGNHDIAMWLGERLGMYHDFGPSTKAHTWGNTLLSKYPIVKSKHYLLPSPLGELAPAVTATVNISGSLVDFVTTHMGNDRDILDRKLQSIRLSKFTANSENPVVFLGYVTSKPFTENYVRFVSEGRMIDIDETDTQRFCEYIFFRGLQRLGYARISHGGLSDTEVQMARFRIPENPGVFEDHKKLTINADDVPVEQQFSKAFGPYLPGHSHSDDHRYHMSTPKYFLP
ncbi:PGAP2-interacting protein-like isoform X2 [Lineus longissimus]|uniref:PGAP2-interacting protein-like isoform X2 n=1 Tax=Lineus longissimus TaxID=88925 RepID=UPI00315DAF04